MICKYVDRKGSVAMLTSIYTVSRCCIRGESEDDRSESMLGIDQKSKPGVAVAPTKGLKYKERLSSTASVYLEIVIQFRINPEI